ncbi:MAG TPA: type IV pilus secretin PilQ [Terriglobales bacterium]|nr:type IV pilus secretin PilQ [Terriglobales bacterium]
MRLKQRIGSILLLLLAGTMAAANTQLTGLSVAAQGNATVVALHMSGTFTHTEYRPTDTLLLVDMHGVSAGNWKEQTRTVATPGVSAYHVLSYSGANGTEVARVELALTPGADVKVGDIANGLEIQVTMPKSAAKPSPALLPVPKTTAMAVTKPATLETQVPVVKEAAVRTSSTVTVSSVAVVRGNGTLDVEIAANGPLSPSTMKLSSPARVVVDLMNAVPSNPKVIAVNSTDVKDVRIARFQDSPPVTRIVVDLTEPRAFDLVPSGNKVTLKVHTTEKSPASTTVPNSPKPVLHTPAQPVLDASKPAPQPSLTATVAVPQARPVVVPATESATQTLAQNPPSRAPNMPAADRSVKDFVMLEPQFTPKSEDAAPAVSEPKAAAESAARVIEASNKAAADALVPPVSAAPQAATPATNLAQVQRETQISTPLPPKPKYTGEPISVNLKDVDLKDFFRLIHEISGLNIVLDPNVRGTLTLVLDDVPWDQALDLVLANNGLDRKLEGNVLRIATVDTLRKEAEAVRAKNEAEALSVPKIHITHFLSYAQAKDLVPTVKRFLSQRGDVIADVRTNSLIISDIPFVIPEVQRLLAQLDRKTQEVEIEARVIAATRNFARDIGVQLGFGWGNNTSAAGGSSAAGFSPTNVTFPPGAPAPKYILDPTGKTIPLFSNLAVPGPTSGLSFVNATSTYRLDTILTMAEQRGLLKILSRPRVVTQNNGQAVVRQGVRVPVVTAAQLGGPPTTTYVDAFLRLTVTPQITVESTIFMAIDVENTTPDFSRQVAGNPTLITQQATTQVLVSDGGTVVIGGVIQTQNSINVQQVPLLGDVPVLGNLFKRRSVSTSSQELLFFVTPKIVQT